MWTAVIVSIAFIVFYTQTFIEPYLQPPAQAPEQTQTQPGQQPVAGQGSSAVAVGTQQVVATGVPGAGVLSTLSHPSSADIASAPKITVTTDRYIAQFSTLGGRLLSLKLKGYALHQDTPELVDLVTTPADGSYPGGLYVGNSDDGFVQYHLAGDSAAQAHDFTATAQNAVSVPFEGALKDGTVVKKSFELKSGTYLVNVTVQTEGASAKEPIWLEWSLYVPQAESHERLNPIGFRVFTDDNKVDSAAIGKIPEGAQPPVAGQWLALGGRYFFACLIPAAHGPNTETLHETLSNGDNLLAARVAAAPGGGTFTLYLGPKDGVEFQKIGYQLYRNIDLGTFSFIAFPLLWLLRFFHSIVGNYGLAIIILTLFIKTIFLPLTMVSFRSAKAMQALQPEIKALRERITDPTQLNQEMMALYKKRNVNPMGGCFPVLIQIPVFFGLINVLYNAIELRHAPFAIWIHDLSAPEHLVIGGLTIPLMVVLLCASMFAQQLMMPAPGIDPTQRKIMLAMPLVISYTFLYLPAGLVLYYIVNNTISITQQMSIRSERNVSPLLSTALAGGALFTIGFLLTRI